MGPLKIRSDPGGKNFSILPDYSKNTFYGSFIREILIDSGNIMDSLHDDLRHSGPSCW